MSKKLEIWEDAQSNPCLFEEFKPPVASRGKKQGIVRQQMSLHELFRALRKVVFCYFGLKMMPVVRLYWNNKASLCSRLSNKWIFFLDRLYHSISHPVEKSLLLSSWCRTSASNTQRMA